MSWTDKKWFPLTIAGGLIGISLFAGKKFNRAKSSGGAFRDGEIDEAITGIVIDDAFAAERGCYPCPTCKGMMYVAKHYYGQVGNFGTHCSCSRCGENYMRQEAGFMGAETFEEGYVCNVNGKTYRRYRVSPWRESEWGNIPWYYQARGKGTPSCWNCKSEQCVKSNNAESFNAMSFNQWSQDEMNEELHGGRNMQFKEWLDDEVHTHGNIPLKKWGYEEEHDEPEHQHAESRVMDEDEIMEHYVSYWEDEDDSGNIPLNYEEWKENHLEDLLMIMGLDAESYCSCDTPKPRHVGVHPTVCKGCDMIITDDFSYEQAGKKAESKELKKDSCCCGATKSNPCACMYQGVMSCSAKAPMCACYKALAEKKGAESYSAENLCQGHQQGGSCGEKSTGECMNCFTPMCDEMRDYCDGEWVCYSCDKMGFDPDDDDDDDYDAESFNAERIQYNYVVHREPKGSSKGGWFTSKNAESFSASGYNPIRVRIISEDCIISHPSDSPMVGAMSYSQTPVPKGTILSGSSPNRFTYDIFFDLLGENGEVILRGEIAERHYEILSAESFSAENRCSICSGTGHNSRTCPSHTMSICGKCGGSDFIQEPYYDGQIYCQKCEVFIHTNELKTVKNPKWKEMFGAESNFDKLANKVAADYEQKGYTKKEALNIGNRVAYSQGVKKYGKGGMAAKAKAGRVNNAESFEEILKDLGLEYPIVHISLDFDGYLIGYQCGDVWTTRGMFGGAKGNAVFFNEEGQRHLQKCDVCGNEDNKKNAESAPAEEHSWIEMPKPDGFLMVNSIWRTKKGWKCEYCHEIKHTAKAKPNKNGCHIGLYDEDDWKAESYNADEGLWNDAPKEQRLKWLKQSIPSIGDKYADYTWRELTPRLQEEMADNSY